MDEATRSRLVDSGLQGNKRENSLLWRIFVEYKRGRRFENDEMEKLFQRYVLQTNKIHLTHLLGLLIATLLVMLIGVILIQSLVKDRDDIPSEPNFKAILLSIYEEFTIVFSVLSCIIVYCISMAFVVFNKKTSELVLSTISYALTGTFVLMQITLTQSSKSLWSSAFFLYINYALLPVRLLDATLSGICLSIVHVPLYESRRAKSKKDFTLLLQDQLINLITLFSINVVGVLTHFPADMSKRKAFMEIRQFVRVKLTIQKETMRQQSLLKSVLPEHLIEEMKRDLAKEGGSITKRKIYMKTYEPVSILFADIVGFTSLADSCSASFVVELLNDLYCSFDKLAKKHRCLRIKLLGDCYYCVSGLPKPSNFHASHCVNMGLDMTHAMQDVRAKFDVEVDIRVGIHTGKVQCGVLGLKKWQFDIWSKDVDIANNMEAGGMPGKVHISEATRNHLKIMTENYVMEPAFGYTREPALKGIVTYFVTYSTSFPEKVRTKVVVNLDSCPLDQSRARSKDGGDSNVLLFVPAKKERDIEKQLIANLHSSINARSIRRLKKSHCYSTVLWFKDRHLEKMYNQEPDRMLPCYFLAALVTYLCISTIHIMVFERSIGLFVSLGVGLFWVSCAYFIVVACKYEDNKRCPKLFTQMSHKISRGRNLAQVLALATILITYITTATPLFRNSDFSLDDITERSFSPIMPLVSNPEDFWTNTTAALHLNPPSYQELALMHTILIMTMTGAFQNVMFVFKFLAMLGPCVAYASVIIWSSSFTRAIDSSEAVVIYFLKVMAVAASLLLMLIQSQQSEGTHRLDFVWQITARSDTENAQQLQMFNQKLLENILPAHVASHYLAKDRPKDELYHEHCWLACILFAYITNFSFTDVVGEDPEHNITILHDIISDIDELLNKPVFASLEKIKSTGAIYMAASGLSLKKEDSNDNQHVVAMAHFALLLRSHMEEINLRHNTSFGIKIGICMGPVVAGVIGASKPQYDIWGNTVNVASRMYSTGLQNHIQITENFANVVSEYGFTVQKRGMVYVKGKGDMITYFLVSGPSLEEGRMREDSHTQQSPPDNSRTSRWWQRRSFSTGNSGKSQSLIRQSLTNQNLRSDGSKSENNNRKSNESQTNQRSEGSKLENTNRKSIDSQTSQRSEGSKSENNNRESNEPQNSQNLLSLYIPPGSSGYNGPFTIQQKYKEENTRNSQSSVSSNKIPAQSLEHSSLESGEVHNSESRKNPKLPFLPKGKRDSNRNSDIKKSSINNSTQNSQEPIIKFPEDSEPSTSTNNNPNQSSLQQPGSTLDTESSLVLSVKDKNRNSITIKKEVTFSRDNQLPLVPSLENDQPRTNSLELREMKDSQTQENGDSNLQDPSDSQNLTLKSSLHLQNRDAPEDTTSSESLNRSSYVSQVWDSLKKSFSRD